MATEVEKAQDNLDELERRLDCVGKTNAGIWQWSASQYAVVDDTHVAGRAAYIGGLADAAYNSGEWSPARNDFIAVMDWCHQYAPHDPIVAGAPARGRVFQYSYISYCNDFGGQRLHNITYAAMRNEYLAGEEYINELRDDLIPAAEFELEKARAEQIIKDKYASLKDGVTGDALALQEANEKEALSKIAAATNSADLAAAYGVSIDNIIKNQKIRFMEQTWLLSRIKEFSQLRAFEEYYDYTETGKGNSHSAPVNQMIRDAKVNHPQRDGLWIYPVQGSEDYFVNKLIGNPKDRCFYTISPDKLSYLLPKVKFYKELHEKETGKEGDQDKLDPPIDFPVPFFNHVLPSDMDALFLAGSARGSGVGLDSFNWEYKGSNPVSATRDITAKLLIKAQSFEDIIKKRTFFLKDADKKEFAHVFRYSDLAIRTTEDPDKGPDLIHYKLKVVVGWGWDAHGEQFLTSCEKDAIANSFMTFYLTIIDHKFNVNEDATIDFEITYRAYLESALSSPHANVLMTEGLLKSQNTRKDILQKAQEEVKQGRCPADTITKIKEQFLKVQQLEKALAYQSILDILIKTKRLYTLKLPTDETLKFNQSVFSAQKASLHDIIKQSQAAIQTNEDAEQAIINANNSEGTTKLLNSLGPKNDDAGKGMLINFFYLGDILDAAIENMMNVPATEGDQDPIYKEFSRMRIVLGPLEIIDPLTNESIQVNLADVPISVNFLIEWFLSRVAKKTKVHWYLMEFIKDLVKTLVLRVLKSHDHFNTSTFSQKSDFNIVYACGAGQGESCPLRMLLDEQHLVPFPPTNSPSPAAGMHPLPPSHAPFNERIDLDNLPEDTYSEENLPILGINRESFTHTPNDIYQYAIIYATDAYPRPVKDPDDQVALDFKRGIPHFHIGLNAGPVKTIEFSKNDQPYIREARYFRDGFDGLSQLREPYNITITMYGNAKIYPGTMVYIDPTGLGPGEIGKPSDKTSLAYTFGFGGYHLVTEVNHEIASGKFETVIIAKFIYRGVGTPRDESHALPEGNDLEACEEEYNPLQEATKYSSMRERQLTADLTREIEIETKEMPQFIGGGYKLAWDI